jgi:hypothetical protein
MVDQNVLDYVNNGLKQGHSADSLRQALLKRGWPETEVNEAIQMATGQMINTPKTIGGPTTHMGLLTKMIKILTSPSEFFEAAKADHIGDALKYYAVIAIIPTAIMIVIALILPTVLMQALSPDLSSVISGSAGSAQNAMLMGLFAQMLTGLILGMVIVGYFISLIATFIVAGIYHVLVLLFGGKRPYGETYKAFTYASTPFLIIGWIAIPLMLVHIFVYVAAAIVIGIWSLVVMIKGLSRLQEISAGRAAAVIFTPVIVILVIVALLGVFTVASYPGVLGGQSFSIPPNGAFCTNGRISVVVANTGSTSISSNDWIIKDVLDASDAKIGTMSVASVAGGQSGTFTSNCGGACVAGTYKVTLGTLANSQSSTVIC